MPTEIFHAVNLIPADGVTTDWDFSFDGVNPDLVSGTTPYLYPVDVKVQELSEDVDGNPVVTQRSVSLVGPARVKVLGAPIALGNTVRIYRETEVRFPLVDYRDRQVVTEADLDLQARQAIFVVMEATDTANTAMNVADEANVTANIAAVDAAEALVIAGEAKELGTTAVATADQASATASNALTIAEQALVAAQQAEENAEQVELLAQAAADDAAAAANSALAAQTAADIAVTVANAVDGKAQSALDNSTLALDTANNASAVADAIAGKAQTALDNSAAAVADAAEALSTANAIDGKAQDALDTADAAAIEAGLATAAADAATLATANKLDDVVPSGVASSTSLVYDETPANTKRLNNIRLGTGLELDVATPGLIQISAAGLTGDVAALDTRLDVLELQKRTRGAGIDTIGIGSALFSGLPAWATKATLILSDVSFDASTNLSLRIGTASGIVITAYVGRATNLAAATLATSVSNTALLNLSQQAIPAAQSLSGRIIVEWYQRAGGVYQVTVESMLGGTPTVGHYLATGQRMLSALGTLDRIELLPSTAAQFDGGYVRVIYE